jgi:hypothetical protein
VTHSERDEGLFARASGVPDDFEPDDGKPAMEHPDECGGAHGREALAELLASVESPRNDAEFMSKLLDILERDREIFERLADL